MQKTEVKVIVLIVLVILWVFIATAFGIQNKQHRDTIEVYEDTIKIYEEYYELDEQMDIMYREWRDRYQSYSEAEYFLKFHQEKYLRYLELKKIIGETEK